MGWLAMDGEKYAVQLQMIKGKMGSSSLNSCSHANLWHCVDVSKSEEWAKDPTAPQDTSR
jgi:hypothetical protein